MAAAVEGERDPAARAARILLSLRYRPLKERPEWAPMQPGEASSDRSAVVPKRPRSGRPRSRGEWAVAQLEVAPVAAGSGRCSNGEERDRSPAPRPAAGDAPALYHGAPAGSGSPSTSPIDRAQPRPRHAAEKATPAATTSKDSMAASSPVTPLDYCAGGSGASSSADDAARPEPKRKARGSGGAWSGDEGCSSPAKRTRVDTGGEAAVEEKPISISPESNMQSEASESRDTGGKLPFKFDLNLPWTGDEDCPGDF